MIFHKWYLRQMAALVKREAMLLTTDGEVAFVVKSEQNILRLCWCKIWEQWGEGGNELISIVTRISCNSVLEQNFVGRIFNLRKSEFISGTERDFWQIPGSWDFPGRD